MACKRTATKSMNSHFKNAGDSFDIRYLKKMGPDKQLDARATENVDD
jgi:hypothetical protein